MRLFATALLGVMAVVFVVTTWFATPYARSGKTTLNSRST